MNIDHVKEIEQNKFDVVYILQWTGCPKVLQLCENGKNGKDFYNEQGVQKFFYLILHRVSKSFTTV